MKDSELPRLLDASDAPEDLRRGLQGLRSVAPSADRLAALGARLGVPEPGASQAGPPKRVPASTGRALLGKVIVGAGVVVTAGLWLLSSRSPEERNPTPGDARETTVEKPPQVIALEPAPPSAKRGSTAPDATPSSTPTVAVPPTEPSAGTPVELLADPGAKGEGGTARSDVAAPGKNAPARSKPGTRQPPSSSASPALQTEMDLLREARASLPVDPGEALAFAEQHRARFPRGALTQEREILAITALVKLGRKSEATDRAARFRSAYPGSAYLRQIDRLLPP